MLAKMNNFRAWVSETRADVLFARYEQLLKNSGFTIINDCCKMFSPQGFTALFLLSESHFAIHTFPERGKTYIELSSCVDAPFHKFVDAHDFELTTADDGT